MAFFACQKQEVNAPEEVKVEGLNFSAEKPEFADASKTEWTGETIQWSKGDKISIALQKSELFAGSIKDNIFL